MAVNKLCIVSQSIPSVSLHNNQDCNKLRNGGSWIYWSGIFGPGSQFGNLRTPVHTGRRTPHNTRKQIKEHIVVNGSVHTARKQHERISTQIWVESCLRVLCEPVLYEISESWNFGIVPIFHAWNFGIRHFLSDFWLQNEKSEEILFM